MKIKNIFIAALMGSVLFTSCKKVLDKVDQTKGNADLIFGDSSLVKQNMDYLYDRNLPTWFSNDGGALASTVSGLSDESTGDNKFLQGTVTSADVGDLGTSNNKDQFYGKIREINTFIRDLSAGPMPAGTKNRFLAQAYFFRAFKYFNVVRVYGGVPLVTSPLSSIGDDNKIADQVARSSTSDCIKQITADLDTAIKYLPKKWPQAADWGRITSGAAAAFKGRVLLTWASPEFNPTNDQTRWQAAFDANTQAITLLTGGGFGLFTSTANNTATNTTSAYANMWFTEVNNPEAVMVTGFNNSQSANLLKNNGYDKSVRPAYLGAGSSSTQPTWDFVKLYPMKDGKTPGDATSAYAYTDQKFYKNRDPRFDATIAYNGCTWPTLALNTYKLWTYLYYTNAAGTATKSTEISGATTNGFYLRKATSATATATDLTYSGTDWMEIRYAEVLLNQAEAAAELNRVGAAQEAYTNLIAIRRRAGIDAGTGSLYGLAAGMDKTALVNAIMLERAIEFGFEGKRFWDLRRRNLLQSLLNTKQSRLGVIITLKNTGTSNDYIAATRDAASLDALYDNNFVVATNKKLDTKYNLNWQSNYNFFAIPPAAINSDPNIVQTNGWDLGGFDPFK